MNECIDIWAEISRADGSVGWCLMASCAATAYFGAWCPDEHIERMFADGVPLSAGQFAPNGTAIPDGDGFRISGRYSFGSGINHAQWAGAGVFTEEPEGTDPRFLFAIYPVEKAQITGNWDVMGLQTCTCLIPPPSTCSTSPCTGAAPSTSWGFCRSPRPGTPDSPSGWSSEA